MITCILLSGGSSERFGSPKALARFENTTVIEHLQQMLLKSPCDEIIVVLGGHAREVEPSIFIHSRIRVVHNKDHYLGQTSSVQAGWREASSPTGILFLPVDCPLVKTSSIEAVIRHFKEQDPDVLIPTYHGKKGHPPVFHQRLRSKLLDLPHDKGLNSLFADHPPQTMEIDDPGIIKTFNTPEEFKTIISKR